MSPKPSLFFGFVLFGFILCFWFLRVKKSASPLKTRAFLLMFQCLPLFVPSLSHFLFHSLSLYIYIYISFSLYCSFHAFSLPCFISFYFLVLLFVFLGLFLHAKNNINSLHLLLFVLLECFRCFCDLLLFLFLHCFC